MEIMKPDIIYISQISNFMLLQAIVKDKLFKEVIEVPQETLISTRKFARKLNLVVLFGIEETAPLMNEDMDYTKFIDTLKGRDELKNLSIIKYPIEIL